MLNIDDRLIKEVSPKVGANALSVLLAIAIHLNKRTNRAFPSHHRLMELTGLGRDAVYKALSKLQDSGLLKSEQPIDSKSKKFGRRVFRLTTRFIKIFVDAADAEPLPEYPYTADPYTADPYTADPYTADPYTENQETYQLNEIEQLNKIEQINKSNKSGSGEKALQLEAKTQKEKGWTGPAGGNLESWVQNLTTDYRVKDGFCIGYKIPESLFDEYVRRFKTVASAQGSKYHKQVDVTTHFWSWSATQYEKTKSAQRPGNSHQPAPEPAGAAYQPFE